MHKEKEQKACKFFVVPGSSPTLLSIPYIETLGVLTIKYNTIGRLLESDAKISKMQGNCQYERAVQTEGRKPERCAFNR